MLVSAFFSLHFLPAFPQRSAATEVRIKEAQQSSGTSRYFLVSLRLLSSATPKTFSSHTRRQYDSNGRVKLTRRQTLLDLVRLVRVLQDQGVEVSLATDLQLDVLALGGFLETSAYKIPQTSAQQDQISPKLYNLSFSRKWDYVNGQNQERKTNLWHPFCAQSRGIA